MRVARTVWHALCGPARSGSTSYFVRDLRAPFGGFKDSGIGREGGKLWREFFTEAKTVVMEM
jgi:aminomuconate-semialdehyde/2-hydroxymuconate-6-semialdehyde dehydrogenase